MIRVLKRNSQMVSKDRCRFLKCDVVFSDVCDSLFPIPLKFHKYLPIKKNSKNTSGGTGF